jgi:hypothetical protein
MTREWWRERCLPLLRVEYLAHADTEAIDELRHGTVAAAKHTVLSIGLALKHENRNSLCQRVDDPVLGDTGLSVIERLFLCITSWPVGADNFDYEISAKPILVLVAWIARILKGKHVWLTEFSWPHLKAEWSKENLPCPGAEQQQQHLIQEGEDDLMIAGWHRKHLNHAVRKLNQMIRLITQFEVLLNTPQALEGFQIQVESVNCTNHAQAVFLGISRHTSTPYVSR